jgi:predicted DNA-binding transcriptional regulator AlpA
MDTTTLALHISVSPSTIDNWVAAGILPPPRKRGGKLMWQWAEVDAWLTDGGPRSVVDDVTAIREAVRKARAEKERGK